MKQEAPVVGLINHNKFCNLENMSATERAGCVMVENLITELRRAARHRVIPNTNVQISRDERPSCRKHELFASRCKRPSRAHFITKDVVSWGSVLEDRLTFLMGNGGLWPDTGQGGWDPRQSGRVSRRGQQRHKGVCCGRPCRNFPYCDGNSGPLLLGFTDWLKPPVLFPFRWTLAPAVTLAQLRARLSSAY